MLAHGFYEMILATVLKCLPDTTAPLEFQFVGVMHKRHRLRGMVHLPYDDCMQLPGIIYTPVIEEMRVSLPQIIIEGMN